MCLNPGDIIGNRYRIDCPLTLRKSEAERHTYLAEDRHLPNNRKCVVKEIKPKSNNPNDLDKERKRFEREAKALFDLGMHSQIPQLFASFEENEKFYLVQEFIEGHLLNEELPPLSRQLNETEVIELLLGILEVLDFVHQNKVIHRDIKPSNLIRRKQDQQIVLIDFGAVKEIRILSVPSQSVTRTIGIGTPYYMPAEQQAGNPKLSSDVYAVGMIGIEAMGLKLDELKRDQDNNNFIWRDSILDQPMVQVSNELGTVIDKMICYYFTQRYQSAGEALEALKLLRPKPSTSEIIQLTVEQHQQAEKEQKQREEYEKKLRQSEQEVQRCKQEVDKLKQELTKERQQQRSNQNSKSKSFYLVISMLAALSTIAASLIGINLYNNNPDLLKKTYLKVCNKTSIDFIYVAIMYREGEGWKSEGWWKQKKGECTKLFEKFNYQGEIYIYGFRNNFKGKSDELSFCVKNAEFTFKDSDKMECSGENYKVNPKEFIVDTGVNTYIFEDNKAYRE